MLPEGVEGFGEVANVANAGVVTIVGTVVRVCDLAADLLPRLGYIE
jgi:hypothetical protein